MQNTLFLLFSLFSCLLLLTKSYDLKENMIVNGNFSEPKVDNYKMFTGAPESIPGWYCTDQCEINNCDDLISSFTKGSKFFPNCTGQILEIEAYGKIQNISQKINL